MDSLYREHLIELYSEKKNFGELKDKTHQVRNSNDLCNDEVIFDLIIKDGKISEVKFHGKMCFVSTVCAEALTENIIGMTIDEIKNLSKEDIDKFLGADITATRAGCELMPLNALKKLQ